jgi:2-haloalkanoic acid dehalogenase type II
MRLSDFRILTFDTYGTLIDWETGISTAMEPLIARKTPRPSADDALEAFGRAETQYEAAEPGLVYSDLLGKVYRKVAGEWGVEVPDDEARAVGRSVKDWPAFADAPEALKYLRRHFLMATLTNCDRISYMGSNARLEIEWDAVYTAQDVGSYKPNARNFDFMLERLRQDFGIRPHEILHVAQSLTHDHVPATKAGLTKVWIDRRHDKEGFGATVPPGEDYRLEFQFNSMADFAAAHRAEQAAGA